MEQAKESPYDLISRSYSAVDAVGVRSYEFIMRNGDCVHAFFNASAKNPEQGKPCLPGQERPRSEFQELLDQIRKHGRRLPDQVLLSSDL